MGKHAGKWLLEPAREREECAVGRYYRKDRGRCRWCACAYEGKHRA